MNQLSLQEKEELYPIIFKNDIRVREKSGLVIIKFNN